MKQLVSVAQMMVIIALGYALAKKRNLDLKTISCVGLYLFIPALLFKGLYASEIGGSQILNLSIAFLIQYMAIGTISFLTAKGLRLSRVSQYSFTLSTVSPNAGMMGISVVLVTFGESAAGVAALIYALAAFFLNTIGLFLAAGGVLDWKRSLARTVRMPVFVAVFLAIILNVAHVKLSQTVMSPISTMAGAVVPLMLVLLGGQISNIRGSVNKAVILSASFIRLIMAPIIAYFLVTFIIPLPVSIAHIFIVQVSMPTAVNAIALTTELDSNAELVASITSASFLLSIITIPILLMIFA